MPYDFDPADRGRKVAAEKAAGITQIATDAQVTAGTRDDRVVSAKKLKTRLEADGALQYAEVAITSAELLAIRATPKELVAAPGAGKVLQFLGAQLILDYNSAAYAETADNLAVRFENGTGAKVSDDIEMTGFIDQIADTLTTARPKVDAIVAASGAANKALVLHNIGDGEFTTGNSPMRVKVLYAVHSTGL